MKKSERLNQELFFLSNKTHFNLSDLMKQFCISKSTALRDIVDLENLGVPIYSTNGKFGGYALLQKPILPNVYFNQKEIMAIFFSLQLIKTLVSSPFGNSYQQINHKLISLFSENQQTDILASLDCVQYNGIVQLDFVDNLDLIFEYILNNQAISFTYNRKISEVRYIQPIRLVIRGGHWYTIGLDLDKETMRTFRCDYMVAILPCDQKQANRSRQDILDQLSRQEQQYRQMDFKVSIKASGRVFYKANAYPNIMIKEEEGSTYLVGKINPQEIQFLANYLLGYGNDVLAINPPQVLAVYKGLVEEMVSNIKKMG
ncbi:MAG: WYL domain-containing protein [Lactococcus sp.]|jgi:predicted DNA-binding transcriptional regulator YafY|uniref:Putative DeoR family transcriptional regulator n=1 Tax=Pseudolactococcus piscium MKFS47 TaxID=297352 RepID=A0A0D6DUX8_9LACT|nr:WYL domain-containing protein [Lactococcus piscium]MBR6895776.1 WYL domain-containing protein [Lactococcus sp.]CEN27583.1 Putative DeoR family transcriptional regulator [Lactococcus piscium MKFS47]